MLQILVLICPLYIDHTHCDLSSALDVIRASRVNNPEQCGFLGQAMLAPTVLVPDPSKQYAKVVCRHALEATR